MLTCADCKCEAIPNADDDNLSMCCGQYLLNEAGEPATADEIGEALDEEADFWSEYGEQVRREGRE